MMYNPVTDSFTNYESVLNNKIILPTMENIGYQPDITDIGTPTEDGNIIMKPARPSLISPEEIFTPLESVDISTTLLDTNLNNQDNILNNLNNRIYNVDNYKNVKLLSNRLSSSLKKISSDLMKKLMDRGGFTDYLAAGILGNATVESLFNSKSYNGNDVGLPSGGLFGWRGSNLSKLKSYAKSKGKSYQDIDVQIDFLIEDLKKNNPNLYNSLKSSTNEIEAAKNFMKYEKFAGYDGTLNSARSFQKQMKWSDEKMKQWIENNHNNRISYAHEIYENYKSLEK